MAASERGWMSAEAKMPVNNETATVVELTETTARLPLFGASCPNVTAGQRRQRRQRSERKDEDIHNGCPSVGILLECWCVSTHY